MNLSEADARQGKQSALLVGAAVVFGLGWWLGGKTAIRVERWRYTSGLRHVP